MRFQCANLLISYGFWADPVTRPDSHLAAGLGLSMVADQPMPIMFGRKFLEDPARAAERQLWRARNHRKGVTRAVTGVITRRPVIDELGKIRAPTLIMVGEQDVATVPTKAERIHQRIAGSKLVSIPGAGHTLSVGVRSVERQLHLLEERAVAWLAVG